MSPVEGDQVGAGGLGGLVGVHALRDRVVPPRGHRRGLGRLLNLDRRTVLIVLCGLGFGVLIR